MLPFRRTERIGKIPETPQAPKPPSSDPQADHQRTLQPSSIRETISLLEADLSALIGDVHRACTLVCREAEDSAAASDRITSKTDSLLSQAGSANRDLTQFAAAIEELARSSENIGDQVHRADKLADEASASAELAGRGVEGLKKSSAEISQVTSMISTVARQTNLLALNATIEAARAGEHGLGFAVVADEVRKLAEKSTQSTKEIADLIQSIQREARQAVENMEHSTRIVEEGLSLGNDLGSALHKISDVVTEVYKFSQEIGAATNEQSVGSSQIAKATNRLTEITQEISSAVEEQASGAQAVVRAMDKMRELVQQSASSSTELSAAAEQMLKLSRNLLDTMDRFVIDRSNQSRYRNDAPPKRRPAATRESGELEYAELTRS